MMRNHSFLVWVLLLVDGVFAIDEVSVSLMVRDSVTLHSGVTEIQRNEKVLWNIQGEHKFLAVINKEDNDISVPGNNDERFKGRLELDDQTGSLTITDTRITDSRVYELRISSSNDIKHKRFNVAVHDEMKTESVKEGKSITLHTGVVEIRGYDLILWKFEDYIMARINRTANRFSLYDSAHGKFKDRLELHQTGSLTIIDTRTTDSGVYHLNMSSSTHTVQRTFGVTVRGAASGIRGAGVGLVVWAVTAFLLQDL
ncbi:uncharacterized protein LOC131530585 isoform X1 [Onychostoma macrolepis]|uniref:Immunoglobulin domain-containing protein n=1 Tax=Onychostoma macrolepis TaxID=369639 RepID=A0A7J6BUU7_9TELE|nr:uncharacterized protein LOC131530585 isoform X1 [Onychostoma macrolepis]KAF4097452.1 hypothetical protein G5714_021460 [Onychostoma macrolepis]